ncbi:hypothetical protein tinsulaeT_10870 [Thalassotalea insulae]|uniref:Uncharacterized protein n=1 Tax=Thalassotalea insulae TaxID=2056778 RepID=A0ABQ6GSW1_9GAMM|nr:hypothetical protein [Thalassotalea insulae]GLX77747.1 hypothetical protein tinsulaeT_10870 [Thalassotalea insulae]
MDSTSAWQYYADNIVKLTVGQIDPQLQWFCSSGLTTPYALVNAENQLINDAVYRLGNSIPALSNSYIPYSDLFTSYQLFLNMLTPELLGMASSGKVAVAPDIKALQQSIAKQLSGLSRNPLSFVDNPANFIKQRSVVIKSIHQQEQSLSQAFKLSDQQRYANIISDARSKIWLANNITEATGWNMRSSTTAGLYFPRYEMPGFVEQFSHWRSAKVNPVTIEINQSSINQQACHNVSQCQAMALDQNLSPNININDPIVRQASTIEVGFQRLGSFDINPGLWFNLSLIRLQRRAKPDAMSLFFGDNGTLKLMPSKIILGFRPWVRYRMTSASYQASKAAFKQRITSLSGKDYKFKDVESTIEYGPTTTSLPTFVGVLSTRL